MYVGDIGFHVSAFLSDERRDFSDFGVEVFVSSVAIKTWIKAENDALFWGFYDIFDVRSRKTTYRGVFYL